LSDESNDVLVWLAAGAPEQQRAGGSKRVEGNGNLQKICIYQNACFSLTKMLTSKIIADIIESHSEFFGYANSCNKYEKAPPPMFPPF